jgi:HAMP domain-containing protein
MSRLGNQSSLSRDFALLALTVLLVLLLISGWVSYMTYSRYSADVSIRLDEESARIEKVLNHHMEHSEYLLHVISRQLLLKQFQRKEDLAELLKNYESRDGLYAAFSLVNASDQLIISSNHGILETPVDVSDRDYVSLARSRPGEMFIGKPIEGRVSGKWIIPAAIGVADHTGKYLGCLLISLDISILTQQIQNVIRSNNASFVILSSDLKPLTDLEEATSPQNDLSAAISMLTAHTVSQSRSGLLKKGNILFGSSRYSYYRTAEKYPYIIVLEYDTQLSDDNIRSHLWSRILQVFGFAVFFILFLWIMRMRMIRPILMLAESAREIIKGNTRPEIPKISSQEIQQLANEISRIADYIAELNLIDGEMRHKLQLLKQSKELTELEKQSKSEFLSFVCEGIRKPVLDMVVNSQSMKDQIYGPIENRRYRQCAADIYAKGNYIISEIENFGKFNALSETYLREAAVSSHLAETVQQVSEQLSKAHEGALKIYSTNSTQDPPTLSIHPFILHQILLYLLLYISRVSGSNELWVHLHTLDKSKAKWPAFITISGKPVTSQLLEECTHQMTQGSVNRLQPGSEEYIAQETPLRFVHMLLHQHNAALRILYPANSETVACLYLLTQKLD